MVLKHFSDVIAPFVAALFNRTLDAGHFPGGFEEAFITPAVKKAGPAAVENSRRRPPSALASSSAECGQTVKC